MNDKKALEEFKKSRNIKGTENVKNEIDLVIDSYEELYLKFGK